MSEWRGLHNHERHSRFEVGGGVTCERCWAGDYRAVCYPDQPCRCCLAAEVEALREKVKQHEVVFKVQAEALKSTREQMQRVRDAIQVADDLWDADLVRSILRALDGDNDA